MLSRRFLSLLLILALLAGVLPVGAMASETLPEPLHFTWVNPLYADVLTEDDLNQITDFPVIIDDDIESHTSFDAAAAYLRDCMEQRQTVITFGYQSSDMADFSDENLLAMFYAALAHTGVPTEGDYLYWQYGGASCSGYYEYDPNRAEYRLVLTYVVTYYTTAQQEAAVTREVNNVLSRLNLNGLSDYKKICAVYDYICDNITYDYDNLNNPDYTLKYTAYAALINKTAVCQGYALLLYRFALEMGIDCRLIAGLGFGGRHGWNIVKLGNYYYNVDSTWDAGESFYNYFLLTDENFWYHTRDAEYATDEFYRAYPMGQTDYQDTTIANGSCGSNLRWSLSYDGHLIISGTGAMTDFSSSSDIPWNRYYSTISSVTISDGVTHIGARAFTGCSNLPNITIPDSVTSLGDYCFFGCTGLRSISLPDSVTTLGARVFRNCSNLDSITFSGHAPDFQADTFSGVTAVCSYPSAYCSWKENTLQQYGGAITWLPYNSASAHHYENGSCTICGKQKPTVTLQRISGPTRYETGTRIADSLKETLEVDAFQNMIVASGTNFADALAGSYLSAVKNAPILLSRSGSAAAEAQNAELAAYISSNLAASGTVYILGGTAAVPQSLEDMLTQQGITVVRLRGATRYETNLRILEEAGVSDGDEILVCTGTNFADSLSASALGKPILLVNNLSGELLDSQQNYLENFDDMTYTIIGGTGAVSAKLADAIDDYGQTARLSGKTRYETSVLVAKTYFDEPSGIVLAYAANYPDGLCGGALAYATQVPLILTANNYEAAAAAYAAENGIHSGTVLGGASLISDETTKNILGYYQ